MFLSRIHLNPRCREARRDLANPYDLHSTLCRAFSKSDRKCPGGEFLWRLEPESDLRECTHPRILVQSQSLPAWSRIGIKNWLAEEPDSPIDLSVKLKLSSLKVGGRYRFRLRANPCVTRNGKRQGLLRPEEQEAWIVRQGERQHGFSLPSLSSFDFDESVASRVDVRISQEQMLRGKKRDGAEIRAYSVLYDGILTISDTEKFRLALQKGIGHGKAMGLGLLSVVPVA
jgi:CRISPR system Cascade subunit CasE